MGEQEPFEAIKVSEHVYWVGAIDWGVRDFHGYLTKRGSTYNAYLVVGDDIILMDTVKAPFKDELMSRISSVADPREIRYLISNHSEMDHTGCLPQVVEEIEPEKIFASRNGVKALSDHFHFEREVVAVEDGQTLSLGGLDFTLMETRMLHWPDSMVSYLGEDRVLISQDGFGMHLASAERFDDELPDNVLVEESAKYYANILMPYSPLVTKLLEKVEESGLKIDIIAPDHGPVWRKRPEMILDLWSGWALQEPTLRAVVVYDTMWGSTDLMARAIADGLLEGGATPVLMPLRSNHRSDVMTQILEAGALIAGSPTINNNIFPTLADVLTYAKGLKPKNLVGAAFGSYGWSGEAVKQLEGILEEMKVQLVADGLRVRYVPDEAALTECRSLGLKVAERLREVVS